jgi:hypothetical protein
MLGRTLAQKMWVNVGGPTIVGLRFLRIRGVAVWRRREIHRRQRTIRSHHVVVILRLLRATAGHMR